MVRGDGSGCRAHGRHESARGAAVHPRTKREPGRAYGQVQVPGADQRGFAVWIRARRRSDRGIDRVGTGPNSLVNRHTLDQARDLAVVAGGACPAPSWNPREPPSSGPIRPRRPRLAVPVVALHQPGHGQASRPPVVLVGEDVDLAGAPAGDLADRRDDRVVLVLAAAAAVDRRRSRGSAGRGRTAPSRRRPGSDRRPGATRASRRRRPGSAHARPRARRSATRRPEPLERGAAGRHRRRSRSRPDRTAGRACGRGRAAVRDPAAPAERDRRIRACRAALATALLAEAGRGGRSGQAEHRCSAPGNWHEYDHRRTGAREREYRRPSPLVPRGSAVRPEWRLQRTSRSIGGSSVARAVSSSSSRGSRVSLRGRSSSAERSPGSASVVKPLDDARFGAREEEAELQVALDPIDRVAVHPGQLMDVDAVVGPPAEADPDVPQENERAARPGQGPRRIEARQGRQAGLEHVRTGVDPHVVPDGVGWAGLVSGGATTTRKSSTSRRVTPADRPTRCRQGGEAASLDSTCSSVPSRSPSRPSPGDRAVPDPFGGICLELNRHARPPFAASVPRRPLGVHCPSVPAPPILSYPVEPERCAVHRRWTPACGRAAASTRASVRRPGDRPAARGRAAESGRSGSARRDGRGSPRTSTASSRPPSPRPSRPPAPAQRGQHGQLGRLRCACRARPTGPSAASVRRRSTPRGRRRRGGAAGPSGRPVPRRARPWTISSAAGEPGPAGRHAGAPRLRQTGRMWPPLRSVLLTTASNSAIGRRRRSEVRTRSQEWTAGSVSIQSWTMPGPNGPSRSTVGGTIPQPRRVRDEGGGDLPVGQGLVGEVPQRPLEADRLVDRRQLVPTCPKRQ